MDYKSKLKFLALGFIALLSFSKGSIKANKIPIVTSSVTNSYNTDNDTNKKSEQEFNFEKFLISLEENILGKKENIPFKQRIFNANTKPIKAWNDEIIIFGQPKINKRLKTILRSIDRDKYYKQKQLNQSVSERPADIIMLAGPPGVGKTYVANILAKTYKAHAKPTCVMEASELQAATVEDTKKIFAENEVIVLDSFEKINSESFIECLIQAATVGYYKLLDGTELNCRGKTIVLTSTEFEPNKLNKREESSEDSFIVKRNPLFYEKVKWIYLKKLDNYSLRWILDRKIKKLKKHLIKSTDGLSYITINNEYEMFQIMVKFLEKEGKGVRPIFDKILPVINKFLQDYIQSGALKNVQK